MLEPLESTLVKLRSKLEEECDQDAKFSRKDQSDDSFGRRIQEYCTAAIAMHHLVSFFHVERMPVEKQEFWC